MNFPIWAPAPLREAYQSLGRLPEDRWVRQMECGLEVTSLSRLMKVSASDYLIGIGSMSETLLIVEKLATEIEMRHVWEKLANLEEQARNGQLGRVLNLCDEIVSCSIAARCATVFSVRKFVTRPQWKARHKEIADAAMKLYKLLSDDCPNAGFSNIFNLFTRRDIRNFASEYHSYIQIVDDEDSRCIELDEEPAPATPEEIEEDIKEWEKEIEPTARGIERAMRRAHNVTTTGVLLRLAELATIDAENPPYLPQETGFTKNRILSLSLGLNIFFYRHFARYLDSEVATILRDGAKIIAQKM